MIFYCFFIVELESPVRSRAASPDSGVETTPPPSPSEVPLWDDESDDDAVWGYIGGYASPDLTHRREVPMASSPANPNATPALEE